MASRPTVTIATADGKPSGATLPLPAVFTAPIRPDIVQYAYRNPEITGGKKKGARKGNGGEKIIGLTLCL
jgi:ribosomal protein L4